MALRALTKEEAEQVVYDALATVASFQNKPGKQSSFTKETIAWEDILKLPPVTKPWLYTQVLVSAYMLKPGGSRPSLNQVVFFKHVENTKKETVAKFRNFLMDELTIDL